MQFVKGFILIFLLLRIGSSSATTKLQGYVLDAETREPIPYVSISLEGTTRGTATNEQGFFLIVLQDSDLQRSLKFTSIAYETQTILVSEISKVSSFNVVLNPSVKLLNEIAVTSSPINPVDVLKSAIEVIPINYNVNEFNLEFYSQISASNTLTKQSFNIESIILGYYKGYATLATKKFEIQKKRMQGDNPLKGTDYPFWPTLEIHRADLLADPAETGIFHEKYLDKFDFTYKGIELYDGDSLYCIHYQLEKPTTKVTGYGLVPSFYRGVVYIATTNFAVLRHDIETDNFSYSIRYRKLVNHYYPYMIKGERTLNGQHAFSKITNTVRLLNTKLEEIRVIDGRTNEFANLYLLEDDETFWSLHFDGIDK